VEASEGRTYREPTLLGNTPYMLLIRIGADGEYQTRIWHADDPSRYMTSVDVIPPGGSWEGRGWDFVIKAYSGVARVDSYAELSFSDEYVLPNAPPVLPCQGAGATETAEATTEADIAVTYQDDFDGAAVSEEWIIWDQPPSLENGAAVFREEENWNALMRSGFEPGEGVLILFRHSGDYIGGMNLEIGDYEDETYRFVGAQRWDTWWSSAEYGKNGRETVLYGDPILNADEWYYLLLYLSEDGQFHLRTWRRDTPSAYETVIDAALPSSDWVDDTWNVVLRIYNGTLTIDSYQELRFRVGSELPDTPDEIMPIS
jgi:hypothetical protein